MLRKIYLHFLLLFFTIGKWLNWEYAKDRCKDLEFVLNDSFIDAMTKIIEIVNKDPNFFKEIIEKNNITNIFKGK